MSEMVRLRDSLMIFRRPGNVVDVLITSSRQVLTFQATDACIEVLQRIDGGLARSELIDQMATSGVPAAEVEGLLETLAVEGLLQQDRVWGARTSPERPPYFDRRDRFLYELACRATWTDHADVEVLGERLAAASVVLIGLGGMGSWLARGLAGAGIGRLVLCDPDSVALENLANQALFELNDVGRLKVDAIAAALRRQGTRTVVDCHPILITRTSEIEALLFRRADFVVAAGNIPTANALSALVAGACQRRGVAHSVGAGYAHANGTLGLTVVPGVTPCWNCLQHDLADPLFTGEATLIRSFREPVGMIPMFPAILANYLAWEIIRVLIGAPPLLAAQATEMDFETLQSRSRPFRPKPGCGCTISPKERND